MSERELLHRIIDGLPARQVQALLTLLQPDAEESQRRLDALPEGDVPPALVAELDAAWREAEGAPGVTLEDLERGFR